MFESVSVHHMHPNDVMNLNQLSRERYVKSPFDYDLVRLQKYCKVREPLYLNFDTKTRYYNINREPIASSPTALTEARIVIKVMGLYKNSLGEVKMMAHVQHLQFVSDITNDLACVETRARTNEQFHTY